MQNKQLNNRTKVLVKDTLKLIANEMGIGYNQIKGHDINRHHVKARAVAYYILTHEFGMSQTDVAKLFKKSCTNVSLSIKKLENMLDGNVIFNISFMQVMDKVRSLLAKELQKITESNNDIEQKGNK